PLWFAGAGIECPGLPVADAEVDPVAVTGGRTTADPGQLLAPPDRTVGRVQAVQGVGSDREHDVVAVDGGRRQVRSHWGADICAPEQHAVGGVQRIDMMISAREEDL